MNAKVMKITPEIAKEMLEKNTNNRNISLKRVDMYADDMKRGEWQSNGEAICFNESGVLANGQHRLMAVVKSGCTVEMVVIFGVKDDVTLYDRGRNRSVSDAMTFSGMYATKLTCAMARLYLFSNQKSKANAFSEGRIREFHIKHKESISAVIGILGKGNGVKTNGRVNVKTGYFAAALLNAYEAGVPKEVLMRFVEIVKTGFYDRGSESAAVVIRNDILSENLTSRSIGSAEMSMYSVENAIRDFATGYRRKKTYRNTNTRVYGEENKDE